MHKRLGKTKHLEFKTTLRNSKKSANYDPALKENKQKEKCAKISNKQNSVDCLDQKFHSFPSKFTNWFMKILISSFEIEAYIGGRPDWLPVLFLVTLN